MKPTDGKHYLIMAAVVRQALLMLILIAPACGAALEEAKRTQHQHGQLQAECDELLRLAIRRPYGWAWDAAAGNDNSRGSSQVVSMQPRHTPAAGALLILAANLLDEPQYLDAAREVAKGMAAAQETSGRIPTQPIFGTRAGGRDEPTLVPDRAPTIAALAFLLMFDEASEGKHAIARQAAVRAAHWLARQQTPVGGWPSSHPPGADPKTGQRIVRLDSPDHRNSTYALLLAGQVLQERLLARSGQKAAEFLIKLRLPVRRRAGDLLWATTYSLEGTPNSDALALREGADLLASYYTMQVLLGAYLTSGHDESLKALVESSQTLQVLTKDQVAPWQRFPEGPPEVDDPATQPGVFHSPQALQESGQALDSELLLRSIERLRSMDQERYEAELVPRLSARQHAALAMVGLLEGPMLIAAGPPPQEAFGDRNGSNLTARVSKLWSMMREVLL